MVFSMTGYGIETMHIANTTISVEIKSINHKYLDFTPKIPRSLLFLEDKLKKIDQSHFYRGRIEVYIGVEGDSFVKKSLKTEWNKLKRQKADIIYPVIFQQRL